MCHQEGGGKEQPPLVHTSAAELIMCPAAYCCERLEMLLYFPCPNALAAFPILFILCHKMTISYVKHYSLIPQPPFWGEHSPENRSNFQKKKKEMKKRKKNYCHINFYSNRLAHFCSSFAGDQGSLPAPQPSIPRDSECWHKLKPGDLPLRILSLAGVSVRLIDSTQSSLVKSSDRKE